MPNSKDKNKEMEIIGEQKVQEELNELKAQYSSLLNEIKNIKQNETTIDSLKHSVESVNREFEQINKNIQEISDKLNIIPNIPKIRMRKKCMIRRALRRGTVKTVGAVMSVANMVTEKAFCMKEGVEDIMAEAYYESQKNKIHLNETNC